LISFDDAKSFSGCFRFLFPPAFHLRPLLLDAKGAFINDKDLRGFAVWHVVGDSSDNILLDAIHDGIGTEVECTPAPEEESTETDY
jgi:hypothetical protein